MLDGSPRSGRHSRNAQQSPRTQAVASNTRSSLLSSPIWKLAVCASLLLAGFVVFLARPAGAAWTTSLYPDGVVPQVEAAADTRPVELGTTFRVQVAGSILAVRFYKSQDNVGAHTGTLWDSHGNALASVTFEHEREEGWVNAYFDDPVAVVPDRDYVVSYHTDEGYYSYAYGAFEGSKTLGNQYLTASAGLYSYGGHDFPDRSHNDSAYYVDVVFRPASRRDDDDPTDDPTSAPSTRPTTAPTTSKPSTPKPTTTPPTSTRPTTTPPTTKAPTSAPTGGGSSGNSAFPNLANTGVPAGVSLVQVPGQLTSGTGWRWNGSSVEVTAANVTLVGLDINGGLEGTSGLTLRNSKVRCTKVTDWCLSIGAGSTVVASEVGGGANGTTYTSAIGIWTGGPNNVIDGVEVHNTSDGLRLDGGTTVQNSYIHNLVFSEYPGTHSDGSQSTAGTAPVVFRHNTIEGGTNDAVFDQFSGSFTVTGNYLIAGNRDGAQSSYGVGGGGSAVRGPITITNNTFSRGWQVTPVQTNAWPSGTTISGNEYTDGSPID